jgi:hypothetical protein
MHVFFSNGFAIFQSKLNGSTIDLLLIKRMQLR